MHAKPAELPFPPEVRTDGTREAHYADTNYGARMKVAPGADAAGIDIALMPAPIVRVSGRITGFPSNTGLSIQLHHDNSMTTVNATMKKDGTFEIWRLDPGK